MRERKGKHTCSGKCRGELGRRRKAEALTVRDRGIRGLLEAALRVLVAKR